jgi:lysophospholipase L1-like esterase
MWVIVERILGECLPHLARNRGGAIMARKTAAPPATEKRSGLATVIVGVIVVAVLASVLGGPRVEPPGPVLLMGDSLFWFAGPNMQAALGEDGWETHIVAEPGAGITGGGYTDVDWHSRVREVAATRDYEVVVIELGTNGCRCSWARSAIDGIMGALEDVEVVLWLNVRTEGARPGSAQAEVINDALDDAAERYRNLEVVDYDSWLDDDPSLVGQDTVHLTPAGYLVMAANVRSELRALADIDD